MRKIGLTLMIILSAAFNIEACHFPEGEVVEVDGIYYAFDANGWWVAGFKQEQDSVVLKHSVVINGKREFIEDIYIGYPMNGRTTTSPAFVAPVVLLNSRKLRGCTSTTKPTSTLP